MKRILIAGGGTGGHIYPGLATAELIQKKDPECKILFVGVKGGMEEKIIPEAGYHFKGILISGIYRKITIQNILRNLTLPYKLIVSTLQMRKIFKEFKPEIVIGIGGYASYPALRYAINFPEIKKVIIEPNAFPGLSNRMLASKVDLILLGEQKAQNYLPANLCKVTGTPIRLNMNNGNAQNILNQYCWTKDKPCILVMGGSLGAKSINDAFLSNLNELLSHSIQVLWQCGNRYYNQLKELIPDNSNLRLVPFIKNVPDAYSVADLAITRAGAITIAELIEAKLPSILIPSPNVADDHQTHNAKAVAELNYAIMLKDDELKSKLLPTILNLLPSSPQYKTIKENLLKAPSNHSTEHIYNHILNLYTSNVR